MQNKFKNFIRSYVSIVQKLLIAVFLTLVYVFGIGLTHVFYSVIYKKRASRKSFWVNAEGYHRDFNESLRES